jgi:hypothetical protein
MALTPFIRQTGRFLTERRFRAAGLEFELSTLLWFGVALVIAAIRVSAGRWGMNNYLLFEGIIRHIGQGQNIYWDYWWEYDDANHYGPSFLVIIAPFSILHPVSGCFLWVMANATFLWYAIRRLPLETKQQNAAMLFCLIELSTSLSNVQFNPMLAAWLLLAWVWAREGRVWLAAAPVALGFWVKLYGIAGLAYVVASKKRFWFLVAFLVWFVFFFAFPGLFTEPAFVWQTYLDWFESLQIKHAKNLNLSDTDLSQDIGAPGLMRRMFGFPEFKDVWMLAPAALLMVFPLLILWLKKPLREMGYSLPALLMVSVVIFSSSAESATYIVAIAGIAVWFFSLPQERQQRLWWLATAVFFISSLSSTDLYPVWLRKAIIWPYAVKALPVTVCWCWILADLWTLVWKSRTTNHA